MRPTERTAGGEPPPGRPRGAPDETADRELLDLGVEMLLAQNRAHAARLEAVSDFHARRVAEAGSPETPGFFRLTPLQATKAEFGPLLGISEMWLQHDLDVTDDIRRWLPAVWAQCRAGRLDISRAAAIQAQLSSLVCDEDRVAFADKMAAWMERNDDPDGRLFVVPRSTLQRAAHRICRQFPQKGQEESFGEAFKKRRVSMTPGDNGMATIAGTAALHDAMRADQRLTLIAKKRREVDGETRTLDQLRADTLVDLLMGRVTVGAGNGELEDGCVAGSECAEHEDGPDGAPCVDPGSTIGWHDVGAFARPVVNVTVPLTTLAGVDGQDGSIGGVPIPNDLARLIAADSDSVWYRMLTDPAGRFVELSTEQYAPTGAIWRSVVARDVSCVFPGCTCPATVVELDHRLPWPNGPTSVGNLQPLCERHHKMKHSDGFRVVREEDGSSTWTSRFGSVFRTPAPEYPQPVWEELAKQVAGEPARRHGGDFDAERFIEQCCWSPPSPAEDEEGSPFDDPEGALRAAFREWYDAEVPPAA